MCIRDRPLGYGYDDGINSAIQVCHLLNNQDKKMSEIIKELPITYQSPTMAPFCKDEEKYKVVEEIIRQIEKIKKEKIEIDGQIINEVLTVNGVRFTFKDGSCRIPYINLGPLKTHIPDTKLTNGVQICMRRKN